MDSFCGDANRPRKVRLQHGDLDMNCDEPEIGDASSPQQVFERLSDDVEQCFNRIQPDLYSPDDSGEFKFDQSNARTYARAAVACMEGLACFMKAWAIYQLRVEEEIPSPERAPTTSLDESVRSMFALMDRVRSIEPPRDAGRQWWAHLQAAIKIRDRVTCPRSVADLDVSHADLMTVIDADAGFRLLLSSYLEQSPPSEPIEQVDGSVHHRAGSNSFPSSS
jgi:hypothetical protein